jgi:hypothetical protein
MTNVIPFPPRPKVAEITPFQTANQLYAKWVGSDTPLSDLNAYWIKPYNRKPPIGIVLDTTALQVIAGKEVAWISAKIFEPAAAFNSCEVVFKYVYDKLPKLRTLLEPIDFHKDTDRLWPIKLLTTHSNQHLSDLALQGGWDFSKITFGQYIGLDNNALTECTAEDLVRWLDGMTDEELQAACDEDLTTVSDLEKE